MKSLLLGSAAALVVVAGAQAADLPTKKGAPVAEYVKVCKIDGMAGFVIPGSDTCLKITGYMTAQFEAGNLSQGYAWAGGGALG
jgi:opacity protein-like surface antigen